MNAVSSDIEKVQPAGSAVMFRRLAVVPLLAAAIVFLTSALVSIGWAFEIDVLRRVSPGYVVMNPVTAALFALSSAALFLIQTPNVWRTRLANVCAAVVSLAGLLHLCALVGIFDVGVDQIFYRQPFFDVASGVTNRMAPNTALNFLLFGASILLLGVKTKRRDFFPAQYPLVFVLLTSFLATVAYVYGAKSFFIIVWINPMAIHTASSFLLLAVGLLLSKPRRGWMKEILSPLAGGREARRLFPPVVIIPLVLGWIQLKGELSGLYPIEMGFALVIFSLSIILGFLVIYSARLTNRTAGRLVQTEDALDSNSRLMNLLSESENSYRQLADAMPQIVWTARADGSVEYWNQRWFDYTGTTLEQTEGWGWEPVIHPDDTRNCIAVWTQALETGEHYKVEYRFKRADGEYRWHLGRALPVRDAENRVVKWFGTCTDIHDQKLIEEELRLIQEQLEQRVQARTAELERANRDLTEEVAERRRAEEKLIRLSSIVESSDDAIVSKDLSGVIISWNRGAERLYGYAAEEIVGKNISLLVPPGREDEEPQILESIKRGESVEFYETVRMRKDGTLPDVSLTISPIRNAAGDIVGAAKIARDITERKRVERALSASTKREREMIENALNVICAIDADGRFVSVNPACRKVLGYEPEELVGRPFAEFIAPEDLPASFEVAARVMAGAELSDFENRYRHKNGSLVDLVWTAYWSESERLLFAMAYDVTERKQAEEELRDFAARLERSNTELQDFASVASHDLQEPLRKVQAFGDRLKASSGDALDAKGRDYLERMQDAAGRMQTLINDLLSFSRVATKAQPFASVNLRSVTDEVLSDLETLIRKTGARVEVGELGTIDADPMQMRQLLQNLVGNALKFNRSGVPPVVKISGELCDGSAEADGADTKYCLTVEDNGIGFDEKYVDRIFKIFQRLHSRAEYEGTGIGLAVCRKIVERHGGAITAQSDAESGATFTVALPVRQSKAP